MDECQRDVTGHGAAQALQGQRDGGRPAVAALALPDRLRHLRGRPRLPAAGRRGLHQPQRAAPQDPRPARPARGGADRMRVDVAPDARGVRRRRPRRAAPPSSSTSCAPPRSVVAACAAGAGTVIPVPDEAAARRAAAACRPASPSWPASGAANPSRASTSATRPVEFTARAGGGPRRSCSPPATARGPCWPPRAAAVARWPRSSMLAAAARWALAPGRDVTLLCAGRAGRRLLEDEVCAGFLVERLAGGGRRRPPAHRRRARRAARRPRSYAGALARLREDARLGARSCITGRARGRRGRRASPSTPRTWSPCIRPDVDKIVPGPPIMAAAQAPARSAA